MEYYKRNIDFQLETWSKSFDHKPLLIRGARQVGKSSAIRQLGKSFKKPKSSPPQPENKDAILNMTMSHVRQTPQIGLFAIDNLVSLATNKKDVDI